MEEGPEGTPPSSDPDGGDPHPCPEDDEFFCVPDAESQEEAINRFMEGLEQQERCGFSQIDRENLQDKLGFPDKADTRAAAGTGWTPAELNHILNAHVVDGAFGCVEWESQLFRGTMRARCYPFDMKNRQFNSFNPKVCQ